MPLIILGLIVVVGALFLVLSHFKPAIGRRLRGGYHGFGFGGFDGLGAFQGPASDSDAPAENEPPSSANTDGSTMGDRRDDDGKVLFVFGRGEREERSLDEDDGKDK